LTIIPNLKNRFPALPEKIELEAGRPFSSSSAPGIAADPGD
jgi:hypothetical protein